MKVRILKSVTVDVQKARIDELWDKQLRKWDELNVDQALPSGDGRTFNLITEEGDVYLFVPADAFEMVGPKGFEPLTKRL